VKRWTEDGKTMVNGRRKLLVLVDIETDQNGWGGGGDRVVEIVVVDDER
jgi:hypothetical protein